MKTHSLLGKAAALLGATIATTAILYPILRTAARLIA